MKLIYFKGKKPNFGDELNPWLFPKLFPNLFDDDDSEVFLGIGSILGVGFDTNYDNARKKVVFGTGYVPEYLPKPDTGRSDWEVHFVRGQRTASLLNLAPEKSVGDSAILIRALTAGWKRTSETVSFMPHYDSLRSGNWQNVCNAAGVTLIDPTEPVETVMRNILKSKLVICEAMHGAIVADALRVPWIPALPINPVHRMKWHDWASALNMEVEFSRLCPSSLVELKLNVRPKLAGSTKADKYNPVRTIFEQGMQHLASKRLEKMSRMQGFLSKDTEMERVTGIMIDHVESLRQQYRADVNPMRKLGTRD